MCLPLVLNHLLVVYDLVLFLDKLVCENRAYFSQISSLFIEFFLDALNVPICMLAKSHLASHEIVQVLPVATLALTKVWLNS